MPAGRPPKPQALRVLQGNPGKRRLTKEPALPAGASPPAWLGKVARRYWDELAPMLTTAGLLKATDADALAMYCSLKVLLVRQAKQGTVDLRLSSEWRQYASRFGLTPADRAKVGPGDAVKAADPFEVFLGGKASGGR